MFLIWQHFLFASSFFSIPLSPISLSLLCLLFFFNSFLFNSFTGFFFYQCEWELSIVRVCVCARSLIIFFFVCSNFASWFNLIVCDSHSIQKDHQCIIVRAVFFSLTLFFLDPRFVQYIFFSLVSRRVDNELMVQFLNL